MVSPSTRFTVSARGRPGTTPSQPSPSARSTRSTISSERRGRAASWTSSAAASSGTSARPARTESARVSPPGTAAATLPAPSSSERRIAGSSQSGGATMTTASTHSEASSRSTLSARSGRPASRANAFGRFVPSRSPRPAATRTAHVPFKRRSRDALLTGSDPAEDPAEAVAPAAAAGGEPAWSLERRCCARSALGSDPGKEVRRKTHAGRRAGSRAEDYELAAPFDEELRADRRLGGREVALDLRAQELLRVLALGQPERERDEDVLHRHGVDRRLPVLLLDLAPKLRDEHAGRVVSVPRRPTAELFPARRLAEELLLPVRLPQEVGERDPAELLGRPAPPVRVRRGDDRERVLGLHREDEGKMRDRGRRRRFRLDPPEREPGLQDRHERGFDLGEGEPVVPPPEVLARLPHDQGDELLPPSLVSPVLLEGLVEEDVHPVGAVLDEDLEAESPLGLEPRPLETARDRLLEACPGGGRVDSRRRPAVAAAAGDERGEERERAGKRGEGEETHARRMPSGRTTARRS